MANRKKWDYSIHPNTKSKKETDEIDALGWNKCIGDPTYFIMRCFFPYGFIHDDETDTVVFFNREYEIIEFGGKKEFKIDVTEIIDCNMEWSSAKFLVGSDGSTYVGTFYMLYNSEKSPLYLQYKGMKSYLLRLSKILTHVLGIIPNAFGEMCTTPEQKRECERKLELLIKKHNQS